VDHCEVIRLQGHVPSDYSFAHSGWFHEIAEEFIIGNYCEGGAL
jgi:hypothetical protein